jgi:hypothetical protein
MSPYCVRVGSRRRGAARKAVGAAFRASVAVGRRGSLGGSKRGVFPMACRGVVSAFVSISVFCCGLVGRGDDLGVCFHLCVHVIRLEKTSLEGWKCDGVRPLGGAI